MKPEGDIVDADDLLDATGVAKLINYSKRQVYRLAERRALPAERVGCRVVFRRRSILEYLRTGGGRANGPRS